ncbi:chemotaxis protein CheW [Desulfocurvibacter africanus]|uniref:CheW protein n=1 Tax=Desulfocurvibacter africanus subsp. africanus str. Walvis Bay TaxID=690850 RepID=F3YXD8_DESAF|nr:chemotaxis protein CheW [Desulfocurvibacter africanus]EGJ50636.1 CheW protein [Desulfocurvibacter africanus subsp. africanus str. Walvis Bay]
MRENSNQTTSQYLTFILDGEVFALDIGTVREVLEWTTITRVPRTSDFMRGVINLRGNAVPVVDLRLKFGLGQAEKTVNTCIIIVEVKMDDDLVVMGALADSVREVIEINAEDTLPAPKIGTTVDAEFLKGMARQDDEFIIILDIQRLFSDQELTTLQESDELAVA